MKTFQEFILVCELLEGKVEWDDYTRPLQSGLTPREKNRAKRISTGVENPDKSPSEKDLERYGKLKIAHDDEKNKKVPRSKRHEFGLFKVGSLTSIAPKGELSRSHRDHRKVVNPKLDRDTKRKNIYRMNDLKEPKN